MFSWFKKHFIPHEGNDHRPHILRAPNTSRVIAVVLLLEIITFLVPTFSRLNMTDAIATVLPSVLSLLTNNERQSQSLNTLKVNSILNQAAEMKAQDMATHGYFAHTSPDGKTPWYWLEKVGYKYQYAGENLAINFSDSMDVTNAWMASPTHKENIIKENYTEIGTGVAIGMYEGKKTIFVAQVYANPLRMRVSKTLPSKVETKSDVVNKNELSNVLGSETVVETENTQDILKTQTLQVSTPTSVVVAEPTFWQKIFTSPRNTTNVILYMIFGIISFALLMYAVIKIKNYHLDLITNGLAVLSIIGMIFMSNYYLSHRNMVITQSLDYSNETSL